MNEKSKGKMERKSVLRDSGQMLKLIGILVLLFTLATFMIIFSFVNLPKFIPSLVSIGIGNLDSWISFFGSLFGGSLTLVALVVTFKYTDEQRVDEKASTVMPICVGTVVNREKVGQQLRDISLIEISNVSGNLAKDIKIESYVIETILNVNDVLKTKSFKVSDTILEKASNIIPAGKSIDVNPWIPTYDRVERDDHVEKVILKAVVSYSDIFSLRKYELQYSVEFGLRMVQNNLNTYMTNDGNNHYVKEFYFIKETNNHK